jgi:plastocyanin
MPPPQALVFRRLMVSRRFSYVLLLGAALVVGATGCGKGDTANLENGKRLFTGEIPKGEKPTAAYTPCAACHALARANAKGTAGPDLDFAFVAARQDGMTKQTIEGVVRDQIHTPRRYSAMRPNLVTGNDARDVAAYVATVAGIPGKDTGVLAEIGAPINSKPVLAKNGVLDMPADPNGRLAFASTNAVAPAGTLTIEMPNPSPLQHDIALQGDGKGPVVGTGGVSKFTVTLKPGKYTYLCTVPGHADGGMKGTLTVK